MTSETPKILSSAVPEQASADSVYDFLYHDARRVASFQSQFSQYGNLTSVTKNEQAERSKTDSGTGAVNAGLGVVGGELTAGHDISAARSVGQAQTFDPLWTNALNLLDYLDERNLIVRDLSSARLGQFVLVSGDLDVRDLTIIQKGMALPSFQQLQASQNDAPRVKGQPRKHTPQPSAARKNQDFGAQFMALLPHSVQAQVTNGEQVVWCSLAAEGLVVASSDLFLKHGIRVQGKWHLLGVLDALPDDYDQQPVDRFEQAQSNLTGEDYGSILTLATKGMGGFLDGMVPFARMLLGRRDTQFGVTPLLIFREING